MAAWLGPEAQNANNQFGYLFLALAWAFVSSNKLLGISNNWMHCTTTVIDLKRRQDEFKTDWARLTLKVEGISHPPISRKIC